MRKSTIRTFPQDHAGKMDHLGGEACSPTGREAAKCDAFSRPVVERGMVTKLAKDNLTAKEAAQKMRNSTIYSPGVGFMCGIGSPKH